jgi:excisionase family DNA binding protein
MVATAVAHRPGEGDLEEELLTPEQVAKRLQMSPRWVRDHATRRSPRIPAVMLGSRIRFRPADIETFIRLHCQGPSQKQLRRMTMEGSPRPTMDH